MFPHYNKKRQNHEIPSQEEIEKRAREQEVHKKAQPDFFRRQIQDKSIKGGEQNEEEKRRLASSHNRTELGDITNKASSDTSYKEVYSQGKGERSKNASLDQTKEKQATQEQLKKQEHEREISLHNRNKKGIGNDANRNLQDDLKDIGQSIRLRELNKFSMTNRDMKNRGVDPDKFRQVSKELSNALETHSPGQLRNSKTRQEFIEMARKLGLIRPEI